MPDLHLSNNKEQFYTEFILFYLIKTRILTIHRLSNVYHGWSNAKREFISGFPKLWFL